MVIDSGSHVTRSTVMAKREQEVSGCVRRRLCGVLSTLPLEHNRFHWRVRSHQHHSLGDKQSAKTGTLFDAFHSTLLGSEGNFLACFIDSDVLSTPCSWESRTSTFTCSSLDPGKETPSTCIPHSAGREREESIALHILSA